MKRPMTKNGDIEKPLQLSVSKDWEREKNMLKGIYHIMYLYF